MITKLQICFLLLLILCLRQSWHLSQIDQQQQQKVQTIDDAQNQQDYQNVKVEMMKNVKQWSSEIEGNQLNQNGRQDDELFLGNVQDQEVFVGEDVQNQSIDKQGQGKRQTREFEQKQTHLIEDEQDDQNQQQRVNKINEIQKNQKQQTNVTLVIQQKDNTSSQKIKSQTKLNEQKQPTPQFVSDNAKINQQKLEQAKQIIKQWSVNTSSNIPSQNSTSSSSPNSNRKPPIKLTYNQAAIGLYIAFFIEHFPTIIKSKLKTHVLPYLPIWIIHSLQNHCVSLIDKIIRKLPIIAHSYYKLYRILIDDSLTPKPKKVYYENNYANLYGGAKIIMKSSNKIKSINSILQDGPDKYMYTDQKLPLKIIIGLNEQIAIESIVIQSYEMYSCIAKDFKVEGKFTMEDKKWVYLGTFKAENAFGDQQFYTQRKIVRYIKLTFLTSYGKWSYFTLTQVKIKGRNLFADALSQINQKKQPSSTSSKQPPSQSHQHQHESHKQQQQDRPSNICLNQFKPTSSQPHQSNLIKSLITKIDSLEARNTIQNKQLESINTKFIEVGALLLNKTIQNKFYEQMLIEYKTNAQKNYYVIMGSVMLSIVTLCCLICLCLIRRRELAIQGAKKEEGQSTGKFEVKKSSSFK